MDFSLFLCFFNMCFALITFSSPSLSILVYIFYITFILSCSHSFPLCSHTHTHTHINIYLYIYNAFLSFSLSLFLSFSLSLFLSFSLFLHQILILLTKTKYKNIQPKAFTTFLNIFNFKNFTKKTLKSNLSQVGKKQYNCQGVASEQS